jgi:hypothetical protein
MSDPTTRLRERIAFAKARHYRHGAVAGEDYCPICREQWPCETRRFADALEEALRQIEALNANLLFTSEEYKRGDIFPILAKLEGRNG